MSFAFKVNHITLSKRFTCPQCNTSFVLRGRKLSQWKMNHKRKSSYHGPFCNRLCAARYNYSRLSDANNQLELPFMKIPEAVDKYFKTFYAGKEIHISDVERYENIYAVEFYAEGKSRTAYVSVEKDKRMSDSRIE